MNENDQKIRKQWLLMWVFSLGITILHYVLAMLFDPHLNSMALVRYIAIVFMFMGVSIVGYTMYRCIYKKPGTKLLTFCLIMTFLSLLTNPILAFMGRLPLPDYIPYYKGFFLIVYVSGVFWFVACWRMLKVNRKLKAISQSPSSQNF